MLESINLLRHGLRHREKSLPADHRDPANDKPLRGTRLALCVAFRDSARASVIESSKFAEILRLTPSAPSSRGKAKKLALTALVRKLIVLANQLLKYPEFILAI